jgi:predicted dehydrogenase
MGIYPLTFARLMLGPFSSVTGVGSLADSGIDLDVSIAARHESGAVSALTTSMTSVSPRTATVATDQGLLSLPWDFHHPAYAVWTPTDGEPQRIEPPSPVLGSGLGNEAAHVQDCLRDGLTESPLVPHAQTLELLGVMDDLRAQLGVRYAADPS